MKNKILGLLIAVSVALVLTGCPNPTADNLDTKNTSAELSALTVSTGTLSPVFAAETTEYSVSVANAVESITVTGTKADTTSTISTNSGVTQALIVGANTITITVTDQDGITTKNYVVTVTRATAIVISSNANLSNLTVSDGSLSPVFAAGTTEYIVSVANVVESITVTGTKADTTSTISTNSGVTQALSVGANTITITVTAQDGITTKNYELTVTRATAIVISSNANLSNLTVSDGSLSSVFSAETTEYSVSVANAVESITVTGTKADTTSTISTNSGVTQALNVGANTITITVTAQDGITTKNYELTVTRATAIVISSNANLSNLTVSDGSLSSVFSAETTEYSVSVANAVESITVTGTKADTTSTISTNSGVTQALNVGANTITITVTAQDGITTKNYVVTVTRAATSYPSLPAAADGIWLSQGSLQFTISDSVLTLNGITYSLSYDPGTGQIYNTNEGTNSVFNSFFWTGSDITYIGSTLIKIIGVSLPTAANGDWQYGGTTYFSISDSQMTLDENTNPVVYDGNGDGQIYQMISGNATIVSGYKWNGSVFKMYNLEMAKAAVINYTNLPAAANGYWYGAGIYSFSINNSQLDIGGTIFPVSYDSATGQLYQTISGTTSAMASYKWNGSAFVISGMDIIMTKGVAVNFVSLPTTTNGNWRYPYAPPANIVIFSVNNSVITLGTYNYNVKMDNATGIVYSFLADTITPFGATWTGTNFVYAGVTLTR